MIRTIKTAAAACIAGLVATSPVAAQGNIGAVLKTYADIAHAGYEDSLMTAETLHTAINAFVASPSAATMAAARGAWLAARVPYQQTEVYRFGNAIVDDWEGRVNAWPLDEGLIDYVKTDLYGSESEQNKLYVANVIANPVLTSGGKKIDASQITKRLLQKELHEAGGVEANVATGYHAIEFLLWGQDLNGTGPGAGSRPYTDFSAANCTGGNCARRAAYLLTSAELLIDDLREITAAWAPGGEARKSVMSKGRNGLANIITGMGSLSYGELAGERMKLGLLLHDPEEEHDCFSDNTHNSHYYDAKGIRNVYLGRYTRVDGRVVQGPSLAGLVKAVMPPVHADMVHHLDKTMDAMNVIVRSAGDGMAYDQLIGEGNTAGNTKVQAAIDALTAQTRVIEKVTAALKLSRIAFEGSDSLDDPKAVFK
ncbi:MAG: putative iron-regulated protein [Paracoccaceae bacterium]|jgi:putative iron-regulated protein